MSPPAVPQALRSLWVSLSLLVAVGCGGGSRVVPSAGPEDAVRAFMDAVRASDLTAMSRIWGTVKGPSANSMSSEELQQRLTVMRTYLEHERYQVVPAAAPASNDASRRQLDVRIERRGCRPVVPFTLVKWRTGWLVQSVDLAQAGNPVQPCPTNPSPGGT